MNRSVIKLVLAFLLFGVTSSWSGVTIDIGLVGIMRNSIGTMVTLGSVGTIVADTDGNGLVDPYNTTLTEGLYLAGGTSDLILGVYQATDIGGGTFENGFDFSSLTFEYSGSFGVNDNLWVMWFPTISTPNSVVGSNVSYGTFRTESADANPGLTSPIGWKAPADGGTYEIVSASASLGGNPAPTDAALSAALTTVPEPTTWALLAASLTTVMTLRRRRSRV